MAQQPTKKQTSKTTKISKKPVVKSEKQIKNATIASAKKHIETTKKSTAEKNNKKAQRSIAERILSIAIYILAAFVLICSAITISFHVASQASSSLAGFKMLEIASNSMYPTLKIGDQIIIKEDTNYAVGDIVTYSEENYYITHRIKSINDDIVITQGDNNDSEDDPIHISDIVGKMTTKANLLNFIVTWRLPIVVLFIALILIDLYLKRKA